MSKNTTTANTTATTADAKADRVAELLAEQKKLQAQLRAVQAVDTKRQRLEDFRTGTVTEANPKGRHNPSLLPDTLRPAAEGELVGGKESHGWVVEVACETCSTRRVINLQDAFQVRFCKTHVAEARKASAKARRAAKVLTDTSVEELLARKAELEALLASKQSAVG